MILLLAACGPDTLPVDPPSPPDDLVHWVTGDPTDVYFPDARSQLLLVGGGVEPDDAFRSWSEAIGGGNAVVIRTSGEDGYNAWLYDDIGGFDSVETLLLDRVAIANDDYVAFTIASAEAVFIAGGDQARHLSTWSDTEVQANLQRLLLRGGSLGGTSAGLAILGELVYSAEQGTVYSDEALADPYGPHVTLDPAFLPLAPLASWVTDSHFAERDRLGRLLAFAARGQTDGGEPVRGIGIDENTALLVGPDGAGTVYGSGAVTLLEVDTVGRCDPGVPLEASGTVRRLVAGQSVALPEGTSEAPGWTITAADGALSPSNPYSAPSP